MTVRPPAGAPLRYAAASHVGLVRDENQDCLVLPGALTERPLDFRAEGEVGPGDPTVFAVVDGMGGHAGGSEAAAIVARRLLDAGHAGALPGTVPGPAATGGPRAAAAGGDRTGAAAGAGPEDGCGGEPGRDGVRALLAGCNEAVFARMREAPRLAAMGATVAGLALGPAARVGFSLGDARVYQYEPRTRLLLRLSEDHRSPQGTVTQSLGGTVRPVALAPWSQAFPGGDPGRWLLCSDGVHDYVPFGTLQAALATPDPAAAVAAVVDAALAAGAPDNLSLVVIDT